uniref:Uncharacterized protein n=1 Tax=Tolypothrix bouteillei VB521301 TaxID=1479485 RepID=A0A0C1NA70_9CYAN
MRSLRRKPYSAYRSIAQAVPSLSHDSASLRCAYREAQAKKSAYREAQAKKECDKHSLEHTERSLLSNHQLLQQRIVRLLHAIARTFSHCSIFL